MKTSFDHKLKEHPEFFDTEIPPFGHLERFEQRLVKHEKKKTRHWHRWIISTSVAATIAILLIFQLMSPIYPSRQTNDSIHDVARFYRLQLSEEIQKVERQLCVVDKQAQQELQKDLEAMKTSQLEKVPTYLPTDDQIALIVLRYNTYIESLQHIQSILEEIPIKNHKL